MVLGLSRTRLRPDNTRILPLRSATSPLAASRDWINERGAITFEAQTDLFGGFPGYADRAATLQNACLRITESFLLADEGEAHGFGLPINWIEGAVLVAQPGKEDYALRIFYRDGLSPRLFTIVFRPARMPNRAGRRSLKAHDALVAGGLAEQPSETTPLEPIFTLPWDQTRDFESENVIWTGQATAPIRVGAENVPSDVWLTTKSLIWGSGEGEGINRIPLPLLMDVVSTRLRDRLGTPVVFVSIGDERTGRFELPFVFDLQTPPDRNFRERGAFLVGVRSRGVPDGVVTPYWQPWRLDVFPIATAIMTNEEEDESPLELVPVEHAEPDMGAELEESPALYQTWPLPDYGNRDDLGTMRRRGHLGERSHSSEDPLVSENDDIVAPEAEPTSPQETAPSDDRRGVEELEYLPIAADSLVPDIVPPPHPVRREPIAAIAPMPNQDPQRSPLLLPEPPRSKDDTDEIPLIVVNPHAPQDTVVAAIPEYVAKNVVDEPSDIEIHSGWVDTGEQPESAQAAVEVSSMEPIEEDRVIVDSVPAQPAPAVDIVVERPKQTGDAWTAVRAYESAAVGALAEALRAIDDRVAGREAASLSETPPTSHEQARALAELQSMQDAGAIDGETGKRRRERLLILGDVSVRLRTVVELHANGYLTAEELEQKRASLTRSLSDVLVPAGR